jgi:hypothetical protein
MRLKALMEFEVEIHGARNCRRRRVVEFLEGIDLLNHLLFWNSFAQVNEEALDQ